MGSNEALSSQEWISPVTGMCRIQPGAPKVAHLTPLLCKLHWLWVCFYVQFKVGFIAFKVLYGLGPGYLKNPLTPMWLACLTRSSRNSLCRSCWPSNSGWWGQGEETFPLWPSALWNILPPEVRTAPILLEEYQNLVLPFGPEGGVHNWKWLTWEDLIHESSVSLVLGFIYCLNFYFFYIYLLLSVGQWEGHKI